jgi:hypothetical protein
MLKGIADMAVSLGFMKASFEQLHIRRRAGLSGQRTQPAGGDAALAAAGGGPSSSTAAGGGPSSSTAAGGGPSSSTAAGGGPSSSTAAGGGPSSSTAASRARAGGEQGAGQAQQEQEQAYALKFAQRWAEGVARQYYRGSVRAAQDQVKWGIVGSGEGQTEAEQAAGGQPPPRKAERAEGQQPRRRGTRRGRSGRRRNKQQADPQQQAGTEAGAVAEG